MKLDSSLFDSIRIKPTATKARASEAPCCEWPGCKAAGAHRAPKGRENEYYRFCLEHVREFNHSYNFFKGMSDDDVARFQKDALTGHRPTWKTGANSRTDNGAPEFNGKADPATSAAISSALSNDKSRLSSSSPCHRFHRLLDCFANWRTRQ